MTKCVQSCKTTIKVEGFKMLQIILLLFNATFGNASTLGTSNLGTLGTSNLGTVIEKFSKVKSHKNLFNCNSNNA